MRRIGRAEYWPYSVFVRYQRPPWVPCEPESRELLGICLKKIKGLNKVKLVDANFVSAHYIVKLVCFLAPQIWQAPTSKRMKVKLTVQKEVMNGAVMQQSMIVDFIVSPTTTAQEELIRMCVGRSLGNSVTIANVRTPRILGMHR